MASLRISVINEARSLAAAADDPTAEDRGYDVPTEVVRRLHTRLHSADDPAKILQWAWRSQRLRFDETGWHRDGLAALYLLAALIDLQHAESSDNAWSANATETRMFPPVPTMAGAAQRA